MLGLVLRVLVTSASIPERLGAKKLQRAYSLYGKSGAAVAYGLDGWGVSGRRFYALGDGYVTVDCRNCSQTLGEKGFCSFTKALGRRAYLWLAQLVSAFE